MTEGIVLALSGMTFAIAAFTTESAVDSLLWGFAGGAGVPGIGMIIRYFYWSSPKRKLLYDEKAEQASIELHDELKEKLRDKSGRYAYLTGILALCPAIVVIAILGKVNALAGTGFMILFLGGYLVFQIIIGTVLFYYLLKKYE